MFVFYVPSTTKFEHPRPNSSCYILPTRIQVPEFFVKAQ